MKHSIAELQEILESFHTVKRMLEAKHSVRGLSITNAQWLALDSISRTAEVSIKDLCGALGVTSSAATQVVNDLVKMGLVSKRASTKDARAVVVSLTPKTKRTLAQLRVAMLENMSTLFSVLSKDEFRTYRELHGKLIRALIK